MRTLFRRSSFLLAALVCTATVVRGAELGEVYFQLPGLDTLDPRAAAVDPGGLVQAVNETAVVHLANGQVLRLEPNTAIKLVAGANEDDVRVKVLSGRVLTWSAADGVSGAGAGSWFVLGPSLVDPFAVEERLRVERVQNDRASSRERSHDSSKSAITGK